MDSKSFWDLSSENSTRTTTLSGTTLRPAWYSALGHCGISEALNNGATTSYAVDPRAVARMNWKHAELLLSRGFNDYTERPPQRGLSMMLHNFHYSRTS